MKALEELFQYFPGEREWSIHWDELEKHSLLQPLIRGMNDTPQDPFWHGEGNVWTHTKMVCQELVNFQEFRDLPKRQQRELFLAALLHDVGKIYCTREEMGRLVSPNHGTKGYGIVRALLWKFMSCAGEPEKQNFRETVCQLIRYHMKPSNIVLEEDNKRLIRIAANGELAKDFNISMLCLLSQADLLGRIAADKEELAERTELCRLLAEEKGCLYNPKKFSSSYTKRAYLSGRLSWSEADLYDDTWGEVILLSGLPGTGKDTWIRENCGNIPEISLDNFRVNMQVSPEDNQAPVISAAKKQACAYLREHQPFVWNATNITFSLREKLVELFENYGASVKIVFLETSWEKEMQRNKNREHAVFESVIEKMLDKLELPERFEAQNVEWHCV